MTDCDSRSSNLAEDDVAIIGLACRTAGDIDSPEKLWEFIMEKRNASGEVPRWRWEPWLRRDSRNAKEIAKTLSKGYFIEKLENFDAAFFGISPKEAEQMDPHQRLALELSWEALEHAGIDPKSLAGSDTSVYMGIDSDDYSRLLLEDLPNIEAWMGIGTAAHGVPNRISYHLDLMGPSTAVDAACASSLVAVHMGRQAILNGESRISIVGGVNVLLAPALTRMLGKAGALSPDGICRSFDDNANGYARGEGGAVIILKHLSSAIADGDHILAILKGSAIAQDGKTNGIMAPNAKAQELVGRKALTRACIDPLTVGYVEAHATATPLGDPTEMSAITALYGAGVGRSSDEPVMIGSIKPNVGHLEAAAGAVGLVKTVLAVKKGQLAPQTCLTKVNTRIDWERSGLRVVQEAIEWSNTSGPRRAAVCSYGYGGTVSHAVIEQFHNTDNANEDSMFTISDSVLLMLSAPQEKRLPDQAFELSEWLSSSNGQLSDIRRVASTLAHRRAHHDYRVVFMVDSREDAIQSLRAFGVKGCTDERGGAIQGRVVANLNPKSREPVWVFSGHGAQWKGMGKELLFDLVFLQAIKPLDTIVHAEAGFSVIEALASGSFMEDSGWIQILTYVVQIGLSKVLEARGLWPGVIIGHSVGEIAASVVAGCLTPVEGVLIVTRRAKLYNKVRDQRLGGMVMVNLPFDHVSNQLGVRRDLVAAINSSPSTCVVSGETTAVDGYTEELKHHGVKTFRVNTDIAFHSPMLEPISDSLRDVLASTLHPQTSVIPIYSTSQTDPRSQVHRDIDYWVNNMIAPVQLTAAINAAAEDGYSVFLEVSTHPIILHSVNETLTERSSNEQDITTISTMTRDKSANTSIQQAIARLYIKGIKIDFDLQFGSRRLWCPDIPRTLWVHKPYYKKVDSVFKDDRSVHDVNKHTLLGRRVTVAGTDVVVYTTTLDAKTKPFPGSHPLDGTEIIPAAVYINTFHHAAHTRLLSDIQLRIPVSMSAETRDLQVIVDGDNISVATANVVEVSDKTQKTWVTHSTCRWETFPQNTAQGSPPEVDVAAVKSRIGTLLPNSFSVDYLKRIGVAGIAFPWQVREHYGNEKEMMVNVDMDPSLEKLDWDEHSWAPLLDAATSVGSTIFFNDPKLRIVSGIDQVSLYSIETPPKLGYLYVQEAVDARGPATHVSILNEVGEVLAKFQSMRFSEVEGASGASGSVDSLVHRLAWVPPKFCEQPQPLDQVMFISTDSYVLQSYTKQLKSQSKTVVCRRTAVDLEEYISVLSQKGSAIVYVPHEVKSLEQVSSSAEEFIWETTTIVKFLCTHSLGSACKLYVVTNGVYIGGSTTGLAHGALYGLSRIIAAEHPDIWGSLIDTDTPLVFPTLAAKYVEGHDILRIVDGLPRHAVMRPLHRDQRKPLGSSMTMMPKAEGTYLITGGLGDLGLETCKFLVTRGARRVVIVCRRHLPHRRTWSTLHNIDNSMAHALKIIQELEKSGATIHVISLDISAEDAACALQKALDALALPPVLGVIHAAGILEDSLLLNTTRDSFSRVLAPKIGGAMTLHKVFPPGTLDFFILFSSIGQLVGTAGQSSYAAGNAFLDALATYRRNSADENAISLQMTAIRGMGMATSTDFLTAELQSKGITDISLDEVFRAWHHLDKFKIDNVVVTRCLVLDEGDSAALPLLEDVVVRRPRNTITAASSNSSLSDGVTNARPTDPKELESWLGTRIRECIANVLMMADIEEIDPRTPVADLGIDSVMTVALRQRLQTTLSVKVPPTLTWNHPTVNHLVKWFMAKLSE
jgi:6-methylsalicylic acid synthase